MYSFDEYTLVVYQNAEDYWKEIPEERYVAHFMEIAENSLYGSGENRDNAIDDLKVQLEALQRESHERKFELPPPRIKSSKQYSGKILLRMPAWLHRTADELATEESTSLNSYIVNRLIRCTTIEETYQSFCEMQQQYMDKLSYKFEWTSKKRKGQNKKIPDLRVLRLDANSYTVKDAVNL